VAYFLGDPVDTYKKFGRAPTFKFIPAPRNTELQTVYSD